MELLDIQLAGTSISESSASNSLLGMPAEIRNRIFELALTAPTGKLTFHASKAPTRDHTY